MTGGVIDPQHPIHVSPEGLRRVLDLSRRALRARDVWVIPSGDALSREAGAELEPAGSPHENVLVASVMPNHVAVANLVAIDVPGRSWSDDDKAMLNDLAAILAAEIHLRDERHPSLGGSAEAAAAAPAPSAPDKPSSISDTATSPIGAEPIVTDEGQGDDVLHILLADDLDLNRKLICDMLSIDGYVCDSVADGAAAVEAVKCKTYDLVLMDMIMPGMDGMEATRAIRALPSPLCDVPIVALTAHSFREQLDNCLRAGMNATLTKPMSFDSLSAAVNTWARHRQAA